VPQREEKKKEYDRGGGVFDEKKNVNAPLGRDKLAGQHCHGSISAGRREGKTRTTLATEGKERRKLYLRARGGSGLKNFKKNHDHSQTLFKTSGKKGTKGTVF